MKNSLKLKEQRATLVEELQAAVDLATSEDRDFTEAEETRQNEIHAEVNALDGKISKAEETEKILLRNAETKAKAVAVDMGASSSDKREQENISKRFSLTEGIRSLAQGRPLGVLREMDQEVRKKPMKAASLCGEFNIPAFLSYGQESRTAYGVDSSGNAAVHSGVVRSQLNGFEPSGKECLAASGLPSSADSPVMSSHQCRGIPLFKVAGMTTSCCFTGTSAFQHHPQAHPLCWCSGHLQAPHVHEWSA